MQSTGLVKPITSQCVHGRSQNISVRGSRGAEEGMGGRHMGTGASRRRRRVSFPCPAGRRPLRPLHAHQLGTHNGFYPTPIDVENSYELS